MEGVNGGITYEELRAYADENRISMKLALAILHENRRREEMYAIASRLDRLNATLTTIADRIANGTSH